MFNIAAKMLTRIGHLQYRNDFSYEKFDNADKEMAERLGDGIESVLICIIRKGFAIARYRWIVIRVTSQICKKRKLHMHANST